MTIAREIVHAIEIRTAATEITITHQTTKIREISKVTKIKEISKVTKIKEISKITKIRQITPAHIITIIMHKTITKARYNRSVITREEIMTQIITKTKHKIKEIPEIIRHNHGKIKILSVLIVAERATIARIVRHRESQNHKTITLTTSNKVITSRKTSMSTAPTHM